MVAQEAQAVDEVALAILDGVQLGRNSPDPVPRYFIRSRQMVSLMVITSGHVQAGPAQLSIGQQIRVSRLGSMASGVSRLRSVMAWGSGCLEENSLERFSLHADAGFLGLLLGVAEVEGYRRRRP